LGAETEREMKAWEEKNPGTSKEGIVEGIDFLAIR
jgi:hypothetical protein